MILALIGMFVPATAAVGLAIVAIVSGRFRGAKFAALAAGTAAVFIPHHTWRLAGLVTLALLAGLAGLVILRFLLSPVSHKRHYPAVIWARIRWRWLMRNLGLGWQDKHVRDKRRHTAALPLTRNLPSVRKDEGRHLVRYPRARIRADGYGIVAKVRTIPGSGRTEFEAQAEHIANAWKCQRVQVSQPKPGRLIVRGLRLDPLQTPLSAAGQKAFLFKPYLGRDEWGTDRFADLSGLTGISVAGLPGTGKTSLVSSLLCQLAGSPAVQFALIDLKGGGDYHDWQSRAWLHCGDRLADAVAVLEDVHALMRARLARAGVDGTPRNAWHAGPTEDNPLIVTVIDEAHTYFDEQAVKGDRTAEGQVRAARALTGQLVRKGRSVLFLTVLLTQKQTSDAIPTAIRDNCRLGLSFGVKTRDAAVAGLGEAIRDYPSYCPTGLRDPAYIGCCTATLPSGRDPFVRLRVPEVTEAAAAERAAATAGYRRDPTRDRELVTA